MEKALFYPTPTREKAVSAEYRVPLANDIVKIIFLSSFQYHRPCKLLKKKLLSVPESVKIAASWRLIGTESAASNQLLPLKFGKYHERSQYRIASR